MSNRVWSALPGLAPLLQMESFYELIFLPSTTANSAEVDIKSVHFAAILAMLPDSNFQSYTDQILIFLVS